MKTCCYCGSGIEKSDNKIYCSFCDIVLTEDNVCENGERKNVDIKKVYFDINYNKTTAELMTLSTFELLQLLQYARKYRANCWDSCELNKKLLRTGKKDKSIADDVIKIATENAKETFEIYRYATRKMFIFENLICERLGYIPKRISRSYLEKYEELMEERKTSKMYIGNFKI